MPWRPATSGQRLKYLGKPLDRRHERNHMAALQIVHLHDPTPEIAAAFTRWESDPTLAALTRPNKSQEDIDRRHVVTTDDLVKRLTHGHIYLLYLEGRLLGEMNYQVDPSQVLKPTPGTAWIGVTIGEADGRGKGLGRQALQYLEQQIRVHRLRRIELGVFAFNTRAQRLYEQLGFCEIGRVEAFTYWQGQMWPDIRMEKYLDERTT